MYATCLHCHRALGRNEAIETFSVGRRLVFDAAKGRSWVVCTHCARWNLTPIEERWEAVEECERAFRSHRLRVQTDNVGLAALADGTELIRVGSPLRPEFAAWRYGASPDRAPRAHGHCRDGRDRGRGDGRHRRIGPWRHDDRHDGVARQDASRKEARAKMALASFNCYKP